MSSNQDSSETLDLCSHNTKMPKVSQKSKGENSVGEHLPSIFKQIPGLGLDPQWHAHAPRSLGKGTLQAQPAVWSAHLFFKGRNLPPVHPQHIQQAACIQDLILGDFLAGQSWVRERKTTESEQNQPEMLHTTCKVTTPPGDITAPSSLPSSEPYTLLSQQGGITCLVNESFFF